MTENPVRITLYRWAGAWGPFKVSIPCGECSLTVDVIDDTLQHELAGIPVKLEIREWLSEWWRPLRFGGWHAPIVVVENRVVSQGRALNRGVLTEAVIKSHAKSTPAEGNLVFGKETCPHCKRAKSYLDAAKVDYQYYDVVKDSKRLYEMLARVKPIIGPKTPVTVPQIWLDGTYVGGAKHLSTLLDAQVEANPERGQSSLSPGQFDRG